MLVLLDITSKFRNITVFVNTHLQEYFIRNIRVTFIICFHTKCHKFS
jgi:hypothetical protein